MAGPGGRGEGGRERQHRRRITALTHHAAFTSSTRAAFSSGESVHSLVESTVHYAKRKYQAVTTHSRCNVAGAQWYSSWAFLQDSINVCIPSSTTGKFPSGMPRIIFPQS